MFAFQILTRKGDIVHTGNVLKQNEEFINRPDYRKLPENLHFPRGNSQSRRHQTGHRPDSLERHIARHSTNVSRILRISFDNWIMRKKFTTLPLFPRSLLKKSVSYPVCWSPNPRHFIEPFAASERHPQLFCMFATKGLEEMLKRNNKQENFGGVADRRQLKGLTAVYYL